MDGRATPGLLAHLCAASTHVLAGRLTHGIARCSCRYYGTSKGRIFDGVNLGWISGFWAARSGICQQNAAWITQSTTDLHGSSWVLSTDMRGR